MPAVSPEKIDVTTSGNYSCSPLKECSATEKLIWTYIFEHGEGVYPVRTLAEKIGIVTKTVDEGIEALKAHDLLVLVLQGSGRRGSHFRANKPSGMQLLF